jgi:heme/copper-type cytochrome/quinol oxidase subunit 4
MIQVRLYRIILKTKVYVRENWGSPFIAGFMLLLVLTAISLAAGLSSMANTLAVYAYSALVVGVILQLACFLKYRKRIYEAVA